MREATSLHCIGMLLLCVTVVWVTVWTWESVPPDPWHHQARMDERGEGGGRIQVVLKNVEQCGGKPEQADTGTVL